MKRPRILINVQGEIFPSEEAKISAMDHGFLYGDSVYETIRTFNRRPFLLGRHLDRLQRSLDRLFLSLPVSREELEAEILRSVKAVPFDGEMMLRIVISRGAGPMGLDIDLCENPVFLIYIIELLPGAIPAVANPDGPGEGVRVVISKIRRNSPRALDPSIKSGNFLNNILAYRDARDTGAYESILCTADGYLAEGATSNIFVITDGVIRTPRAEGILVGITRAIIIEEAEAAGLEVEESNIPPEAFFDAEEAFLCSSVRGVVPIAKVNDRAIGSGRRGTVTQKLQSLYKLRMERGE